MLTVAEMERNLIEQNVDPISAHKAVRFLVEGGFVELWGMNEWGEFLYFSPGRIIVVGSQPWYAP